MKTIHLKIVTPDSILLDKEVESVSIPTVEGEITVLPMHIPILAGMKPGELRIKADKKEEYFSVMRGVAEVDGETITILTDAAEHADDIDEERADAAAKAAKELMAKKRSSEEGYTEAMAELERSLSRIKIIRKRRRGSKVRIDSN
ncbi:ATP synthase F1 subunit epsilon [Candidatus Peregrinibacteria bacterium]|jgi:F-type H+-transporting ATPase subunit epsilon|nr:ATP synthase F1 subunit epsilon [Candidatus Peregrinibacteria bacterium]MBT4148706.1 ATP synthase F1 subunit epsilon [Candidatus Peregrinibacteria bacterium]MBT4366151.1 ATP synthase F1 subunit epsilon [Candidatus Peregrinibacteria bacterium]MBT4456295.1 ATP synthase F1 subunit epsilon [Candidatus Peregrinibacteria bacterium]